MLHRLSNIHTMKFGSIRDSIEGSLYRGTIKTAPPYRRSILGRRGMRPIREVWWTPLRFEKYRDVWRNLRLVESSPEPASVEPSFPVKARVAVYTPGHVGDVLHTAPLLRALRRERPLADLIWIVGPWCESLARRYSDANRVIVFSPAWFQYRRGSKGPDLQSQIAWGHSLENADVYISTANVDLTTLFIGRSLQPSWWCGRPPASELYPVAPRQDIQPAEKNRYESEDILSLASPLGITKANAQLFYNVTEEETAKSQQQLSEWGVTSGVPYAVIAPGAGWPGKQWPVERWALVADELHLMGLPVVFAGTRAEETLCRRVQSFMRSASLLIAGKTTLDELAAIISGARIWLGSDSGGLHLAAALGTATVSLFGPTPPSKWAPRGPHHRYLRAVDGCPDCIPWHPRAVCPKSGACMKKISVDDVRAATVEVLEEILNRKR